MFVEQNKDRIAAIKEFEPGSFIRGLRTFRPKLFKDFGPAELTGDFSPKVMDWAVTAIECSNFCRFEGLSVKISGAIRFGSRRPKMGLG